MLLLQAAMGGALILLFIFFFLLAFTVPMLTIFYVRRFRKIFHIAPHVPQSLLSRLGLFLCCLLLAFGTMLLIFRVLVFLFDRFFPGYGANN